MPGSFPPIPWHWTVGISPRGVGLTGRGNSFPLPCLLRSQNSEYLTDPVRVPCRWLPKELAGSPHPARACGAPPPPPPRGRGQCVAISGKQPYPGWSRWAAVPGSSPGSPRVRDRGDIATGGGADGEGACPLPCLPRSNHLTPRHPHPARACGAPPPPRGRGRGQCLRYQVSSRAPDHGCYRHGGSRRGDSPAAPAPLRDKNLRPFRTRSRPGGAAPGSGRRGAPRGRI